MADYAVIRHMKDTRQDFTDQQRYDTCIHCGKSLSDNPKVRKAHESRRTISWAVYRLKALADFTNDRRLAFITEELKSIADVLSCETDIG